MSSFVSVELLIEYLIRVGTDDLIRNPELIDYLFDSTKQIGTGFDVTPPDSDPQTEKTILDSFHERLEKIARRPSEPTAGSIFRNSIPNEVDVKQYLAQANLKIIHGYPRDEQDLPCISITLGNEDESGQVLGDLKAIIEKDGKRTALVGTNFRAQYMVTIMTTNYDETVIWYHILKYCFLTLRPVLEAYGFREQKISFADVEPAPEYVQAGIFAYQRVAVLNGLKDESIPVVQEGYTDFSFGLSDTDGNPIADDNQSGDVLAGG